MSNKVIDIRDLHVKYKTITGRVIHAVRGLTLSVEEGEVVGFIGPNGAGKSTTIKTLLGFQHACQGSATVFGAPAGALAARRRIGYLPEVALYYPFLTAREMLRVYAALAEIPRHEREAVIDQLLATVKLSWRDREPLRGFSKGMLQRVGIAQAIMGEPDLLILDEVTSGLDPVARYDVRKILFSFKARRKTVFFSSHELSEVTMLCDRVIVIDEGKLLQESPLETLLNNIRRHVIVAAGKRIPERLPARVVLRTAINGTQTYVAESPEAARELETVLAEVGAPVQSRHEEPGSLEDYFVRSINHKVS